MIASESARNWAYCLNLLKTCGKESVEPGKTVICCTPFKSDYMDGLIIRRSTVQFSSLYSFAVKVLSSCSLGFAAGCAAVAMPCRREAFHILGYALGAAFGPLNPKG